jgi:hypothetical protein
MPHETSILWPLTQRFSSDGKAAIIGPVLSSFPGRPSAVKSETRLFISGLSRTIPALKSVSTAPGVMTLTVMRAVRALLPYSG